MVKDINTSNIIDVHGCYGYMPKFMTCADVVQLLQVISNALNPGYRELKTPPMAYIYQDFTVSNWYAPISRTNICFPSWHFLYNLFFIFFQSKWGQSVQILLVQGALTTVHYNFSSFAATQCNIFTQLCCIVIKFDQIVHPMKRNPIDMFYFLLQETKCKVSNIFLFYFLQS